MSLILFTRRTRRRVAALCVVALGALVCAAHAAVPVRKPRAGVWWSLKPVSRPAVPEGTAANPIDRFLNAELASRGIRAVGPADRAALLRRVHLDLTGLPPTPAEQEAFLADTAPDAYEKTVDRLLEDEQHAVRYARRWLDVLRYADADERMAAAPGIHLWRDWIVNALHVDMPYNDFVQIQLTGRRAGERTQMSATGYRTRKEPRPGDTFALGFLARGAGENPQELAINAVDTVSSAFLGMTVSCAKCHDHVYDPVSQKEYYAMKALFDPLVLHKVNLASAAELMESNRAAAETERRRAPLEKAVNDFAAPFKAKLYEERVLMLPPEIRTVIRKPEKQRTPAERKIADDYFPILRIDEDKLTGAMTGEERRKYGELRRRLDDAGSRRDPALPVFYSVEADPLREREKSYVLTSGDPSRPDLKNEVAPGWPFASPGAEPDLREGRVEAFADWLTAPENPLFARVAVNRLWQWHFGEGLARNPSDLGELGGEPSHPALLDWLAAEFVEGGYRMKRLHRLMVTSDAYRRASAADPGEFAESLRLDPADTALWRFRLLRLEAEPVWDALHAAAGTLSLETGGRSFDIREGGDGGRNRPRRDTPAEDGDKGKNLKRRGAYIVRGYSSNRDVTPDFLQTFDVDDGREPCPVRTRTVTAPQALFLMNSPEVDRVSAALADRLRQETAEDSPAAVDLAWRLVFCRAPSEGEKAGALTYLENDPGRLPGLAWLMFNSDEFIYVR